MSDKEFNAPASDDAAAEGLKAAYQQKTTRYFQGARRDMIAELPDDPGARILELGCGEGDTGALALSEGKAGHYVGLEIHQPSAQIARTKLSEVHIGNVEAMPLPFEAHQFDALIVSEVFEHLVDPWRIARTLGSFVRPGGLILASSPNISHYKVILHLMRGAWDLEDSGVMDRTHLRWFTPKTYSELCEQANFEVVRLQPVTPPAMRTKIINRVTLHKLYYLFWTQIYVIGKKNADQ